MIVSIAIAAIAMTFREPTIPLQLRPQVHVGETLEYTYRERVSGSFNHSMTIHHRFVVDRMDSSLHFIDNVKADIAGRQPPNGTYALDDRAVLVDSHGVAKPILGFVYNVNQFGVPPKDLVPGATWSVNVDESAMGMAPGTIHVTAAEVSGSSVTLHLDFDGSGSHVIPGMPGSGAQSIQFGDNSHAVAVFRNGILTEWHETDEQRQAMPGQSASRYFATTDYELVRSSH